MVGITYWVSVPYKKSRDGDYGDLSNPIRHFLAFFFLLIGKSYILIISSLREITGWGLGLPHGDFGDFEIPFSIFLLAYW